MTKKPKSKKKQKYSVVPIDLDLETFKKLKEVAKITNLTFSKVVNVLLMTYIVRERNIEKA
jgi:hypothetical protein